LTSDIITKPWGYIKKKDLIPSFLFFRCSTCGEYIYKGKKFNARKEDVENSDYLGIRIYRFYIKVKIYKLFQFFFF
jgi:hypothetical protein